MNLIFLQGKNVQKIKKLWLVSTISCFLLYPIIGTFWLVCILSEDPHIRAEALHESIIISIRNVIPVLISWHCSYKKNGTAFLTFQLITAPFIIIFVPFINLALEETSASYVFNTWTIIPVILDVVVCSWWYVLSLKLRAANKVLSEKLSHYEECHSSLEYTEFDRS